MNEQTESKFRSRKWIGFLILCAFSLIALYLDKVNGEQWTDFMIWVFAIYAGGNVGEKAANAKFTQ